MPRFAPPSLTTSQLAANSPAPLYVGEITRASDTGRQWIGALVEETLTWVDVIGAAAAARAAHEASFNHGLLGSALQPEDAHNGVGGLLALVDVRDDPEDPESEPIPGIPTGISARLMADLPAAVALPETTTPSEAAAGLITEPRLWTPQADRAAIEAFLFASSATDPPTTFSWSASAGADGYLVEVRAQGDTAWETHDVGDVLSVDLDAIGIYGSVIWEVRVSAWSWAVDGVTREVSAPTATTTVDLNTPVANSPIARLNDPAHVASHGPRGDDALPYAPALPWFGNFLAGAVNASGVSLTNTLTAGRLYAHPFRVPTLTTTARLEIDVRTGAAGSTIALAVAANTGGKPGARLGSAVSVSGVTIAVVGDAYVQTLYPDVWYWALLLALGGAPVLAGLSAGGMEPCLLGGVSNAVFTRPIGLMLDGETAIDADYSAESGWANNTAGTAATFRVVVS